MKRTVLKLALGLFLLTFTVPAAAGHWVPGNGTGSKVEIVNKKTGERRQVGKNWDPSGKKKQEKRAAKDANKADKEAKKEGSGKSGGKKGGKK
jgi:hypothetical protein